MALLHVKASAFCRVMAKIGQTVAYLEVPPNIGSITVEYWGSVGGALGEIARELEKLELRFSLNQISKIREHLDHPSVSNSTMRRLLADLAERIVEELEGTLFLSVPMPQAPYYRNPK